MLGFVDDKRHYVNTILQIIKLLRRESIENQYECGTSYFHLWGGG